MKSAPNEYGLVRTYCYFSAIIPTESFIVPVVVVYYTEYLHFSFVEYSSYIAFLLFTGALAEIPTGYFSDRLGRRLAFTIGSLVATLSLAATLLVTTFGQLLSLGFILSIAQSLASGNKESITYETFARFGKTGELQSFSVRVSAIGISMSALAILLGGYFAQRGYWLPMAIDVVLALGLNVVAVVTLLLLWPGDTGNAPATQRHCSSSAWTFNRAALKQVISVACSHSFFSAMAIGTLCFALTRTSLNFYQPILSEAGWSELQIGVLFASSVLAVAIVSIVIPKKFFDEFALDKAIVGFIVLVVAAALLFMANQLATAFFILAFTLHQAIRIVIPSIAGIAEQRAMPLTFELRTTLVSISLFFSTIVSAAFVQFSGVLQLILKNNTMTLAAIHVCIASLALLLVICRGEPR